MIKNNNQVKLEFGNGDIKINAAKLITENLGIIAFKNQDPPQNIGDSFEQSIKLSELMQYPVIMTFEKTESIDELIESLMYVKTNMEVKNLSSNNESINPVHEIERLKYQLDRAKEYLKNEHPKDGSEPNLEWCIISDLLRIINEK